MKSPSKEEQGMRCWCCDQRFASNIVLRDGIMRGRGEGQGGPFRAYKCPSCHRVSKVEQTPKGRLFASPGKDIGLVEFLFGWIDPLSPDDFLKINDWYARHADRRQHFFERDGDRRYSGGLVRNWLGKIFGGAGADDDAAAEETGAASAAASSRASSMSGRSGSSGDANDADRARARPRPAALPHPYRVLGVERDATPQQIRDAFHRLARKWHPDKQGETTPEQLETAAQRLAELVKAYETLNEKSDLRR